MDAAGGGGGARVVDPELSKLPPGAQVVYTADQEAGAARVDAEGNPRAQVRVFFFFQFFLNI